VATSLAISGSGYYAVKTATVNPDGTVTFSPETYYTRRGDFTLDANGYMVNGAGYYLVGWDVNSATKTANTASVTPIQISQLLDNPVASSTSTYSANLPSSVAEGTTTSTSTISVYDALGNAHDMSFYWVNTGTNTWNLNATISNGSEVFPATTPATYQDYTAVIPFTFSSTSGSIGSIASLGTPTGSEDASGNVLTSIVSSTSEAEATFNLSFDGADTQPLTVDFGSIGAASGTTQFADTALTVSSFTQNGIPRGSFSDVSVSDDGYVTLNYDNGQTKTFYQIPIVQFYAEDQLQLANGDAYQSTITSGSPRYDAAGTLGAGTITSSALEGSNVDIADQFAQLIQAQQVYSANAKTVSTVNAMLQTIMNIIQ
jgi:flagellar hook protein FlgE